jgi:hypothetical protein
MDFLFEKEENEQKESLTLKSRPLLDYESDEINETEVDDSEQTDDNEADDSEQTDEDDDNDNDDKLNA